MHERFGKGSFSGHGQPRPSNTWKDVHYLNAELRVVCQEDEQHQAQEMLFKERKEKI